MDLPEQNVQNFYMQQAVEEVNNLEQELRVNRGNNKKRKVKAKPKPSFGTVIASSSADEPEEYKESGLGVKITGRLFKSVVVPPNMYVVHTRRGHQKPLHIGLGISFRFNPRHDAFLVVPSSMQTIVINANTICKELQGILIQAYVQWIIDDIETAYQRLDFSDTEDPMRVVTLQLKEQAEAAIKDKVATMSINEVLSDKQPIIKELTKRLKEVAEGFGDDRGLGIKIITVQIKEAIVSSATLWQNLQKPFRSSQIATARLAEIENQAIVNEKELEDKKLQIQAQQTIKEQQIELDHKIRTIESTRQFNEQKYSNELEINSYKIEEEKLKAKQEIQELEIENEFKLLQKKEELETKLHTEKLSAELERKQKQNEAANQQARVELEFEEKRQKIANMLSEQQIQVKAIQALPEIARSLPQPDKLNSISIQDGTDGSSLSGIIASILSVLQGCGIQIGQKHLESDENESPMS